MGQLVPAGFNILAPPLLPAGIQSHTLRPDSEAANHILQSQLRRPPHAQLRPHSLGLQHRQTAGPDPIQILRRVLLHARSGSALRSLSSAHGEDIQESALLPDGRGNAAGDGDRRHRASHRGNGGGRRVRRDEEGGRASVRQRGKGVLAYGVLERGDVAAVLRGYGWDGFLDVVCYEWDLHDGSDGDERAWWGRRLWG